MFKLVMSGLVLTSAIFTTSVVMAQPQQTPQTGTQQQAPAIEKPSNEKMNQFAETLVKVETVKQGIQAELSQQPKESLNEEVLEQANAQFQQEATQVISNEGLTIEEYSGLLNLMQQDPEFLAMVQKKVEKAQAK